VPRADIQRRVTEALHMVRLPGASARRPAELSGGQQQRVALARALVNRPTVLLLDEPLSALDLKLRKEMQSELKTLQQTVGITFIYVTHDQDEAITLSDRMVVMNAGHLEQEGTPEEIYERPRSRFVADFIGLTNFLEGTVHATTAEAPAGTGVRRVVVKTPVGMVICAGWQPDVAPGERVTLTLRPEKIRLLPDQGTPGDGWNTMRGIVTQATFLGPQNEYRVRVGESTGAGGREVSVRQQNISTLATVGPLGGSVGGTDSGWRAFGPGERVMVTWRYEASLILRDSGTGTQQAEGAQSSAPASRASVVS
jgi:spermidine/putrescine transport system ATP-binding protein